MDLRAFLDELRRRNVLRAGALYAAGAWLLVQVATQVFPFYDLPAWAVRWVIAAGIIGLPFALAFAWLYEFTPQGLRRESEVAPDASITRATGKALDRWIIAVLAVAVVLLLTNTFVVHRDTPTPTAADTGKSIAVLPLVNESGDPQQDYFSDGLSEDLISALGQVPDLRVIGRNSSFRFRGSQQGDNVGVGRTLGVANLLEGTVRKAGDQVRIVASLIDAADGSQRWSQTYDRRLEDVFAVQSEIATSVATALKATLFGSAIHATGRPPGGNLDAYNALLQGRFHAARRNRADYFTAVTFYQQAIALDPAYALAYARLAIAEQWFLDWAIESSDERAATLPLARANARKAVQLDPELAEAQGALGVTQAWSDLDVAAAEATLRKAVKLDPSNPETLYQLADVTASLARLDEAVSLMRKVIALDPVDSAWHFYLGQYLLALGHIDEAEAELQQAIQLQPTAAGYRTWLVMLNVVRRNATGAMAAAQAESPGYNRRVSLALAYALGGDDAHAQAVLQDMIRLDADVSPTSIVEYYAWRGDRDRAFAWLDHALEARDPGVTTLYEDPLIYPALHDDPRFAAFCRKVGLPVAVIGKASTH